jgi:hypothetical protein
MIKQRISQYRFKQTVKIRTKSYFDNILLLFDNYIRHLRTFFYFSIYHNAYLKIKSIPQEYILLKTETPNLV